ncbi:MAG: peptide chain release factor 1 [Clostridia bacterium]|nr:peptide chain release factor 1 [Clostridia bacterium]
MLEKLAAAENRYEELNMRLTEPDVIADRELYAKLLAEHSGLSEIVDAYRSYKKAVSEREEVLSALGEGTIDPAFKELLKAEFDEKTEEASELERRLKILLTPKDPNDEKNVFMEIRAGAGGEEAALFGAVLYRMYVHYAEKCGFGTEIVDISETELGGIKEIVFSVSGRGAYSRLKYESGVHRVQRVPSTESSGRIHTSTATVAVLPEADEASVTLDPDDVEIDIYRSSGAGGQHINKTDSAIRLTHKPTGIVVTCQDQRSQLKNKEKAFKVLYSKLYELEVEAREEAVSSERRSQVGTGDRSERIRTYNYPQNRVTDHRIDLTLYKLDAVLSGDLDEIIDALITDDQAKKLAGAEEN